MLITEQLAQSHTHLYSNVMCGLRPIEDIRISDDYEMSERKSVQEPTNTDYRTIPLQELIDLGFRIQIARTDVETRFKRLVREWKRETGDSSVVAKRYKHPAYKSILEMKQSAIPLILAELQREPDRWFDALQCLTNCNPAKGAETFYEAVDLWIAWGVAENYIS